MLIIIVLNLIILKGMRKNEELRKKMNLFNIFKIKLLK